jgi:hypothetical protein
VQILWNGLSKLLSSLPLFGIFCQPSQRKSWRRGTPKKRARVYDVVFAYALAHP